MAKAAGSSLAKKGMANATLQKVVENKKCARILTSQI